MTTPMGFFFVLFLIIAMPIAFAMIAAGAISVEAFSSVPSAILQQRLFQPTQSFPLIAIPFFIIAGNLMMTGSLGSRLINLANVLVGHYRGGLGHVSILGSFVFGGVSGSAVADASAVGNSIIPMQRASGYPAPFCAAINASSSTLSLLIPPSIPLILFSVASDASIASLFIAGIIPGILLTIGQFTACYVVARRQELPVVGQRSSWREKGAALWLGAPPLLMVIGIVVTLRFGIATPTEVSVLAVVYALLVRITVFRDLGIRELYLILRSSSIVTGAVMLIIMASYIWSWILTTEHIPQIVANFAIETISNPFMLILAMNLAMIVIGTFLDLPAAILLLSPIFLKIADGIGLDYIQLGVMMVLNLSIGLYTPPVGTTLFISTVIAKSSIGAVTRALLPFYLAALAVLLLVSFVPFLTLAMI